MEEKSLISFDEIKSVAENFGIYEKEEILEAIRFLNDLGSLQYFENNALKDKIIINPQVTFNLLFNIIFFFIYKLIQIID